LLSGGGIPIINSLINFILASICNILFVNGVGECVDIGD
jgi:hypothetical protein